MRTLTIRLPDRLKRELSARAKASGKTMPQMVRELLNRQLVGSEEPATPSLFDRSRALPAELQEQVLDFVESLGQRRNPPQDGWTSLSLATALKGMEAEQWPAYPDSCLVGQV